MAFEATPYANLPTTDEAWDPDGQGKTALLDEVLGDDDWGRFKKAHLIYDPENEETKAGYKLPIARMFSGDLKAVRGQVGQAIAAINGSRAPLDVPTAVRRAAYDNAIKYLEKAGVEEGDLPEFQAEAQGDKTEATRLVRLANVELDSDTGEDEAPKWQHVATAGVYKGYNYGEQPFEFTRETFDEMVKNFRANPSYHLGPNGVGDADVVAWDFHHASEAHPADIAVTGAPAQGWAQELTVKTGPDGKAQLWALTRWLQTAKQYIKDEAYKWASVTAWINAVDPHTGDRIGALLTSIAITNTPFIEGMNALAAERQNEGRVSARMNGWYEAAEGPLDAARMLKDVLGLRETDDVAALVGEISKLQQWLTMGTIPLGVDMDAIVAAFRKILGLPALKSAVDVLVDAMQITGALLEEQAPQVQPGTEAPASSSIDTMEDDMTEFLETLSKRLGVRPGEAAVLTAVQGFEDLRVELQKTTGVDKDTNKVLLAEVTELVTDRKGLVSLRKALGAEKQDDAVERITVLLDAEKRLAEIEPKHKELLDRLEAEDKAKAEAEVKEVIAARGWPEDLTDALLDQRLSKPEVFAAKYPKLDEEQRALTQPGVTAPAGEAIDTQSQNAQVIDLSAYTGPNPTNRLKQWVRDNVEGMGDADDEALIKRGHELRKKCSIKGL